MPDKETIRELIRQALGMMKMSYIPYSHFSVGAALLTDSGEIYTGCNIENAAYSPSVCAERTAFFKAVSEGHTSFRAIAVTGGKEREAKELCTPCGVCRQVMMEFCDPETFYVISAVSPDEYRVFTLKELLPLGFGPENLKN
ncbi:MAG: cytidine deaminase [bacterium]|nr:cytidine deaminase [Lachnospiraceae bacterium]